MRERGGRDAGYLVGRAVIEKYGVATNNGATGEDDIRHVTLPFIFFQRFEYGVGRARKDRDAG